MLFADVHMPEMNGYELLDEALRSDPGVHVIIRTGDYTLDSALDAIRRGATDFLPKPIDRARMARTLEEAAALYDQRRRVRGLEEQLLRVIQNREIQRLGSPEVRHVNVRLIAATNRELRTEVLAGRFREDLFYRLSSIQIRIPSLAERLEDIPLLMQFFLKKYNDAYGKKISGLTRRAQSAMLQHPWPGNVRELENVISSACITATGEFIDLGDLPEQLQRRGGGTSGGEEWRPLSLDEVCAQHIQRVLEVCKGNRLRAAQILGIGRTSLYRYLKRDGMENKPGAHGSQARLHPTADAH